MQLLNWESGPRETAPNPYENCCTTNRYEPFECSLCGIKGCSRCVTDRELTLSLCSDCFPEKIAAQEMEIARLKTRVRELQRDIDVMKEAA